MTIQVENLSKKYLIKSQGCYSYEALRDKLAHPIKAFMAHKNRESFEEFWALKDVSFDVNVGDRVAIIGKNGAGKSTLLKVLSRITPPTAGKVCLGGRTASLLEVGTGFHPELTGRENIYFNGSLLGMTKREINRKFDEIVDFSGVERFLETPVKRYSSGMYVRLAFAVAAHLEPDILFIDEVLAVGDAQFQKKCIGKMEEVSRQGRTILFITHNMGILHFCNKGLFLDKGKVVPTQNLQECVSLYMESMAKECGHRWTGTCEDDSIIIHDFELILGSNETMITAKSKGRLLVRLTLLQQMQELVVGFLVYNRFGHLIINHKFSHEEQYAMNIQSGVYEFESEIDFSLFTEGFYKVELDVGIHNMKRLTTPDVSVSFEIVNFSKAFGQATDTIVPGWNQRYKKIERVQENILHTP